MARPSPLDYFGPLAEGYDRHRPTYPPEALEAMLEGLPSPADVVELGAGTGLFTRLLAARGARVAAVEPNAGMRQVGAGRGAPAPGSVTWVAARAEDTGLPAGSADLVACAQAFHWFDAPRALAETARLLRDRGRLALVWNVRDDADPFTARYGAAVARAQEAAVAAGREVERARRAEALDSAGFDEEPFLVVPHAVEHDVDGLIGRARSCSYWPPPGALRDEIEADLRAAHAEHERAGVAAIAYRCEVTRLRRR